MVQTAGQIVRIVSTAVVDYKIVVNPAFGSLGLAPGLLPDAVGQRGKPGVCRVVGVDFRGDDFIGNRQGQFEDTLAAYDGHLRVVRALCQCLIQ